MPASNNPFYVAPPDVMQSLMSFDQSYNAARKDASEYAIKQARQDAAKMFAGGDQQGAMARIMAVDPQSAALLGHLYQQSPAGITASETAKQEVAQKYAPKTSNVKLPTGEEVTVSHEPGGGYSLPKIAGMPTEAANPYATPGKLTPSEATAGGYARRMFQSGQTINKLENVGVNSTQHLLSQAPLGFGNHLVSSEYQQLDQAQRDFVNADLRRESGATINESEFKNAQQQYFPVYCR